MSVNKSIMTDSERLLFLTGTAIGDVYKFSKKIALSKPDTLYNIRDGKTPITPTTAKKITDTFKNVNPDWLLTGDGQPFKWGDKPEGISLVKEDESEYKTNCPLCNQRERLIQALDARIAEQARTIKVHENSIEGLRALAGPEKQASSG